MAPRIGIVVFPGTNCEHDVALALEQLGASTELIWHDRATLGGLDGVVIPGGFAHGDYLRPGALARFSPVMDGIARLAAAGAPVVGICNGFQVLTEAGMLPGALQRNRGLRFVCEPTELTVTSNRSVLTRLAPVGTRLSVPINHFSGSYLCDEIVLADLRANARVILRYADNPNGSTDDIAGICNAPGNVVGLMPHPERASNELLGSTDGLVLLRSLLEAAVAAAA